MFKILGADGKEYGPVSLEQLREWVREGRAGGQTQVQPAGATTWSPLRVLPEFAEQFAASPPPTPGTAASMPPVVRTIAFTLFIVTAIGALWMLVSIASVLRYSRSGNDPFNFAFYLGWGVCLLSLPIHIICGIGLLRGREWARLLTIGFAIVLSLYGGWGIFRGLSETFQHTSDFSFLLRSPQFLLSYIWAFALLVFNIATPIFLSRPVVRAAFARKTPASV